MRFSTVFGLSQSVRQMPWFDRPSAISGKTAPPPAVLWVMTAGYPVPIPLPRRPALAQSTVAAVAASALVVAALAAAGAGTALLLPRSAAPPNTTMLTPITTTTAPGSPTHEQVTDR